MTGGRLLTEAGDFLAAETGSLLVTEDYVAEEDTNARRALEHYRLQWLAHRRREEDEDDAWLVLQR